MNKNKVIVIGSTNVINFLMLKGFQNPVRHYILIKLKGVWWGQGANQAIAASRLAADTTFISKVGKDGNANFILEDFKKQVFIHNIF